MDDMLRRGIDWLHRMQHSHCASPVEYHRDGTVHTVRATRGQTDYQLATEAGLNIGGHVWDFLILADELAGALASDAEPEPGDIIDADGVRYEVMALGDDIRGWRWSDPYRTTYRIHTRQIGVSP